MSKQKSHEDFIKDFKTKGNQNVIILGTYINNKIPILVKCKIDGYEWYARPYNLLSGVGCPVCNGKAVVPGINDLATLRSDLVKYFVNPEDATKVTTRSNKSIDVICPDCGSIKKVIVQNLYNRGFSCSVCGDGVSFPNKFGRSFLCQLPINYYESEWNPDWLKPYSYDHYFIYNDKKFVLEMDGPIGHGNKQFKSKKKDVDGLVRDNIKDLLAAKHDIFVIRINCEKSERDYIANNILNSELRNIFDLKHVDWVKCEQDAVKNMVKVVCDEYSNNTSFSITDIAKKYGIARITVRKYLKKGSEFGWCEYSVEESIKKGKNLISKRINVFNAGMDFIKSYDSVNQCSSDLFNIYGIKFDNTNIGRAAKSGKLYHNLYFQYA